MSDFKYGIKKKTAVLIANKYHSDQKKCYKRLSHTFWLVGNRLHKNKKKTKKKKKKKNNSKKQTVN